MAVMTKALLGSCSFQVLLVNMYCLLPPKKTSMDWEPQTLKHLECERDCLSRSFCGVLQAYTHCSSSEERHLPEVEQ